VLGSLQLFIKGRCCIRFFAVFYGQAMVFSSCCSSQKVRKFCNAKQFEEDRDKGKFKVDDESVEKVVEVINDLRSENQSTSTQQ
ncbi:3622_t:CDS:2, partial [Rhizophagus irregularis]